MNDSRELILGRIRARLGRNEANAATARAAVEATLATPAPGPHPAAAADLVAAFCQRSSALASTLDTVATPADVPRAVASYLSSHGLPRHAVCAPELIDLDWAAAGIAVQARAAGDTDLVGITGVFRAIAETGTLMLCSGTASPATVSLLPETHIAVVSIGQIVANMESAWTALRAGFPVPPRAVNFISGPSRTGDIEQTIVLGAHGPYRVHVVMIENGG